MSEEDVIVPHKVYVAVENNHVIFGTEEGKFVFTPEVALEVGNCMLEAVSRCGLEVMVQTAPRQLTTMQRTALIARCTHIMRTMRSEKPVKVASHVVDSILTEVL